MMAPALRYEDMRALLDQNFSAQTKAETVAIDAALGRRAYRDITSKVTLPETVNAAVDGYGIAANELAENPTKPFPIIGMAKAGHPFQGAVPKGSAVRIFTGAVMPEGIDCVMMQEFCDETEGHVTFRKAISAGKNARPAGENLQNGEVIITKGELITPAHIGQLAAAGITDINVCAPVKVAVLSTGDELVPSGQSEGKAVGQIYDSNRPMVMAMLEKAGCQAIDGGIIPDKPNALRTALEHHYAICDVVIITGGAADGIEDHTKTAFDAIGAQTLSRFVAIKPGRPFGAARKGDTALFSLPGNPVAVYVCFLLFVEPVLQKKMANVPFALSELYVPSGFSVSKPANERAEFMRVSLSLTEEGQTVMLPYGRKGAGVLSSLTGADGLAELPFESQQINQGDMLRFIPF